MTKDQLLKLPLWQYTGEQLLELLDSRNVKDNIEPDGAAITAKRWLVYGIEGLCELLQCSKNSGVIKDAITQTGRKIVIDAQLALDLIQSSKKGGRRCKK